MADDELTADAICPCSLTTPCNPQCTCANPHLSGGCSRCATYGSDEQRLASAGRIAAKDAEIERLSRALSDERRERQNTVAMCEHLRAENERLLTHIGAQRGRLTRMQSAIRWALGYDEGAPHFSEFRTDGRFVNRRYGPYSWRDELRRRAGMENDDD